MGKLGVVSRLLATAEVDVDVASVDAERALQRLSDHLRANQVPRARLAVLARALATALADLAPSIEHAATEVRQARERVEQWRDHVATAAHHGRDDLAAQARDRVAHQEAGLAAAQAVLHEYQEVAAQLRDLAQLVSGAQSTAT